MVVRATSEYNGCEMPELSRSPVPVKATVCYGQRRIVFKGVLAFSRTKGSWKYGDELKIDLFCKDWPKFEERVKNNGWTRIEIEIPLHVGEKMLRDALDALDTKLSKFM